MKKTPRRHPRHPRFFTIDWGTFPNQTLVFVGVPIGEWLKIAKGIKDAKKDFLSWIERESKSEELGELLKHCKGMFLSDTEHSYSILYFAEWSGNWDGYETLMHELHHAVHEMLGNKRGMREEMEGLAYAQEHLFRQARRKLDGHKDPA